MCKAWQLIFSCFSLCALVKRCLQNNIGAIFFGASPVNVVLDFKDVLIALIVYMLVYLPFLNTKEELFDYYGIEFDISNIA